MIQFEALVPDADQYLGLIPTFLSAGNPNSAIDQLDIGYRQFGGWSSFTGFTFNDDGSLSYPGDPDMAPVAWVKVHEDAVFVYPHAWVAVVRDDGTYEVSRLD